ncbi:hypothetical protein SUGI_0325990 [Cryptomeria japonica]|uniref:uncharacterized protein LOC131072992 n=1 Tax=Cryptomeria japonica TaxID=3369 RepID=UPI002408F065|nr:uncharacterized protein LOC131072992 [Cryptomeria japonica]GLJ18402.1 hypothetical protein SUGI_0325990 [Cryptomeria japonica]
MGRRKSRNTHDFFLLDVAGIARESAAIFVQNLSVLTAIAVLLVSPVSAAILVCRALFSHTYIAHKLALRIRDSAHAAGFPNWRHTHLMYHKLSETLISFWFCFPVVITFSLLARAAVAHTVASIYAGGNRPSWKKLIQAIPRLWKGLVVTYIWAGVLVIGTHAVILVSVCAFLRLVCILGLGSKWEFGVVLGGGIVYSIVFAHVMIVCNLATIVCVMEECNYGIHAVFKALFLIGGKTRIALVMAVVVNLSWAFVERLFVYGVMPGGGGNMRWEAPLLVLMYSMVAVMDTVMNSVFYYTCKSSRLEDVCISSPYFPNSWQNILSCGSEQQDLKDKRSVETCFV